MDPNNSVIKRLWCISIVADLFTPIYGFIPYTETQTCVIHFGYKSQQTTF